MSDLYESMRAFIRAEVRAEVTAAKFELRDMLTREAPKVIEGLPGPAGKDGRDGIDGKPGERGADGKDGAPGIGEKGERGADGLNGKDGASSTIPGPKGDTGERGADGIATREEIEEVVDTRFADVQTRSLADYHRRTYQPGESYKRGDLAIWDGTTWLAMADTIAAPGSSPDWQQFAKKGRDGRDRK